MPRDEDTIKLHTDPAGVVWYADGNKEPLSSGLAVEPFLQRLQQHSTLKIRVLGLRCNVGLVAKLLGHAGGWSVELAGPNALETFAESKDARVALYRMRQLRLSPSLGGWHIATEADFAAYRLAEMAIHKRDGSGVLPSHPAWHDISFLPNVHLPACAAMLGLLIDPRWFVNPHHPERFSQAAKYMGLMPNVMRDVFEGTSPKGSPTHHRCETVLQSWWAPCTCAPEPADMERPNHFIWRRWREAGGGAHGAVRASQKFLDYVLRTWLQQILRLSPGHHQQELFSAEAMLKAGEVKAYYAHAATRK